MRILLLALVLLFNVTAARAMSLDPGIAQPNFQYYWQGKGTTLVMLDHHGGNLYRELRNVGRARGSDYQVIMAGWIRSSGTLWLGLPKHRFCIMPDAIFLFHQGDTGGRPALERDRQRYWNGLPRVVRDWIRRQPVESWKQPDPETNLPWIDWIKVSGAEAVAAGFGRPCAPGTKVNIFGGSHSDG